MQTLAVGAIVSDQQLVDHLYDQNGMFSASIFIERQMSCPVNEIFSEKEKENFVANAAPGRAGHHHSHQIRSGRA